MTKIERRKLSRAARELASEYAEGRGPTLDRTNWCGCAAGQLFLRAGVPNEDADPYMDRMPARILDESFDGILTEATGAQCGSYLREIEPLPFALVFPLLYVADLLDEQADQQADQT